MRICAAGREKSWEGQTSRERGEHVAGDLGSKDQPNEKEAKKGFTLFLLSLPITLTAAMSGLSSVLKILTLLNLIRLRGKTLVCE